MQAARGDAQFLRRRPQAQAALARNAAAAPALASVLSKTFDVALGAALAGAGDGYRAAGVLFALVRRLLFPPLALLPWKQGGRKHWSLVLV